MDKIDFYYNDVSLMTMLISTCISEMYPSII